MNRKSIITVMIMAAFMFAAGTVGAGLLDRVVNIAEDAVKKEQPQQTEQQTGQSTSEQPGQAGTQKSSAVLTDSTVYSPDSDAGVVINGVKWATRNVAAPGKFTANPSEAGMFYQWNRKKAWPAAGAVTGWDGSNPTGDVLKKANDPSPAGWRVPTLGEIEKLLDTNKVGKEWTTLNGVKGRRFTDKATGNSIFLPAPGTRNEEGGILRAGTHGGFWSNEEFGTHRARYLSIDGGWADAGNTTRRSGLSIRAVAE